MKSRYLIKPEDLANYVINNNLNRTDEYAFIKKLLSSAPESVSNNYQNTFEKLIKETNRILLIRELLPEEVKKNMLITKDLECSIQLELSDEKNRFIQYFQLLRIQLILKPNSYQRMKIRSILKAFGYKRRSFLAIEMIMDAINGTGLKMERKKKECTIATIDLDEMVTIRLR